MNKVNDGAGETSTASQNQNVPNDSPGVVSTKISALQCTSDLLRCISEKCAKLSERIELHIRNRKLQGSHGSASTQNISQQATPSAPAGGTTPLNQLVADTFDLISRLGASGAIFVAGKITLEKKVDLLGNDSANTMVAFVLMATGFFLVILLAGHFLSKLGNNEQTCLQKIKVLIQAFFVVVFFGIVLVSMGRLAIRGDDAKAVSQPSSDEVNTSCLKQRAQEAFLRPVFELGPPVSK